VPVGRLIVADNVIRQGAVADAANGQPRVVGARRSLELVAANDRLEATVFPALEPDGYDGLAVVRVG
jgi:predicted O-methyltransferase YrrM